MSVSLSTKGLIQQRAQIPAVIFLQTFLVLFFQDKCCNFHYYSKSFAFINLLNLFVFNKHFWVKIFYHLPRTDQHELSFSYIQTKFIGP